MRQSPRCVIATFLAALWITSVAVACLWDSDTIRMERSRFPSALELITGKFLRHTPEFYQWRIEDRLKRLQSDPTNAALLDDLAVAYDKTGQHELAIETALKTENLHPGRYETAANLGTFYIHGGRPEEGLPHIDRALEINPDAHFGREKYQKRLVEYVLHRRDGGPLQLPLAQATPDVCVFEDTFADFLRGNRSGPLTPDETAAAVKGVLGMMRFGKHDSPVLLEVLGTLLIENESRPNVDAKLLAARAFLKASYEVPDGPARSHYRWMAERAILVQTRQSTQISVEQVESDFEKELDEARAWYADLRDRELSWIREGKSPEAEFDRLYDAEPEISGATAAGLQPSNRLLLVGGTILILVVLVVLTRRAVLRGRHP